MRQQHIIFSFVLASVAGVVAILSVLFMALDVIQGTSTLQSVNAVNGALASQKQRLNSVVADNSWWDEATTNILLQYNQSWVDSYYKKDQSSSIGNTGALAYDRRHTPLFHYLYNEPLNDKALQHLSTMLSPLLKEASSAPLDKSIAVAGYVMLSDKLYIAAVSAFTAESAEFLEILRQKKGYLVLLQALDEGVLASIATNFNLSEVSFIPGPFHSSDKPSVSIYDPIGNTIGYISWMPPKITSQLTGVLSLTLTILLVLVAAGWFLFRKLVRHVNALEAELHSGARNTRILESKNQTLEKIACGETVEAILEHLALSIETVLPEIHCAVFQFDRNSSRIKTIVAPSLDSGFVNAFKNIKVDANLSIHDKFLKGDFFSIPALRDEPFWAKYLNQFNISFLKSAWSEPIRASSGELIGGLIVYQRIEGEPDTIQREIVHSNAHVVGIVLEHKINAQKLEFLAYYDPVTNLVNRHLFRILMDRAMQNRKRQNFSIALLHIDIDRFKHINDTLGHEAADRILIELADRISLCVRQTDTVSRIGGDEFAILITNPVADEGIGKIAEKVVTSIREPLQKDGKTFHITASVGISVDNDCLYNATELFNRAETAMQIAKESGRDQFHFYDADMDQITQEKRQLEHQLRSALDKGEFSLVFQPKVSLQGWQITGLEALIRWHNDTLGFVPPDKFIPIAEMSGLIVPISEFVVRDACRQLSILHKEGFDELTVAINLSAKQFRDNQLLSQLKKATDDFNLEPSHLELELTETMIMDDKERAKIILRQLQEAGFVISIDDFGTGYSSLSYLQYFPLNKLKVDRSFVMNIPENSHNMALTAAIVALAQKLDLSVIAEGVETAEQADFLIENGCDEAQGYFYSKPTPPDGLIEGLIVLRQRLFEMSNR
ncbi:MAG: EAL domain-containing protein [Hahellaceae bacterium]|nr:EAL domain-containing protein [Hahellaceae bacterium]MCP5209916.1 EAL domain-containing protein [Hahellaceae bacterium]